MAQVGEMGLYYLQDGRHGGSGSNVGKMGKMDGLGELGERANCLKWGRLG